MIDTPKRDKAGKSKTHGGRALKRVRQFEEARGFTPLREDLDKDEDETKSKGKKPRRQRKQD